MGGSRSLPRNAPMRSPRRCADHAATAPARGEPLVILAGGGRFPFLVAEAALAAGRPVTVAALIGEADPAIAALRTCQEGLAQ